MTSIELVLARTVLRGLLPYPDLVRRIRVRRSARALATRALWPRAEASVTGEDYARLALLRLLSLQRETRRAVQTRQRESAALLARTAVETCILGLWCLHVPDAVGRLRASEIRVAPAMLTFLSSVGVIPDALIRQSVMALGEPGKLPDVRSMTEQIDSKTGSTLAIYLYDLAYRPASHYFTHATSSALLRHVTAEYRYSVRPARSWVRRSPVRLADACVGLLAAAVANSRAVPAELFLRYGERHAERVLPPLLAIVGRGIARKLGVSELVATLKEAKATRDYLSRVVHDVEPEEREARLRSMYDTLIARLNFDDLPPGAMEPIVDYFVAKVLGEWEAERTSRLSRQTVTAEPDEA
ncbi:hypothetical protein CS0771_57160 [Catellatospora sp. IY07-71]|uniref:hypothetical protein n=1 Tax=Catellatospora sp. IY07-71 TaxID=2728827 RepID=UPI001BB57A9B|nr:hypothetical protein [Catellatospora sp. IY07-71]BCJ76172.1 hypothetical protein CS0771_57160 [Catellatospora sp. IY07-71]